MTSIPAKGRVRGRRIVEHRIRQRAVSPGDARPTVCEGILFGTLALLAVVGLLSPGQFTVAPAESILEVAFVGAALAAGRRMRPAGLLVTLPACLYVAVKALLLAFFSGASATDFVQAYKSFVYLALFGAILGTGVIGRVWLARVTVVLIVTFGVKYGYSVALGLADRPGIYMENNFELIMLLGLFYLARSSLGRWQHWLFAAVALIVLISGSRSAALGLLVIYLSIYLRTSSRLWSLHVLGSVVVGYGVLKVFSSRASVDGGVRLDRLNFLDTFFYEVRDWPVWEFLTGSFPLTPLSPGSCQSLSFYSLLFSHSSPGVCYSVILHSYFLRAVFDHGLLGLVLMFVLLWTALRRSGAGVREAVTVLGLISVSGLSVSAFNNVFAAIVLAVAMGLDRRPTPGEGPGAPRTGQHDPGRDVSSGRCAPAVPDSLVGTDVTDSGPLPLPTAEVRGPV